MSILTLVSQSIIYQRSQDIEKAKDSIAKSCRKMAHEEIENRIDMVLKFGSKITGFGNLIHDFNVILGNTKPKETSNAEVVIHALNIVKSLEDKVNSDKILALYDRITLQNFDIAQKENYAFTDFRVLLVEALKKDKQV